MNTHYQYIILAGILLLGLIMCVMTESYSYRTNGTFGFPLDDPWIHLQFAKNLHDYGSFSYYKNEMSTSGSTSPLYTILLAGGFFITSNEMILSYAFGISFLLIAGFYMFRLSMKLFDDNLLIASALSLLLVLEPRILWASLSGMETTLFIALLIATLYYYKMQDKIYFGIGCGLLLWTRPEALLFLAVLGVDMMYHHHLVAPDLSKKRIQRSWIQSFGWLKTPMSIFLVSSSLYAAFNFYLSGSIFPNTYAAKIKYYSGGGSEFPQEVFHYFVDGHLIVVALFVGLGVLSLVFKILKRRAALEFIPLVWSLGLFFAYWKNLPHLYQEGRYMMPAIPFVLLLGLSGIQALIIVAKKILPSLNRTRNTQIVIGVVVFLISAQFVRASLDKRSEYAEYCKYIGDRQVKTAKWLQSNLPENAVIATHDIGAIAYYSGKKIADMVGLVSPEMINNIGSFDKLKQFLIQKKVTHLALLRNWFEVVNVNAIYQTDVQHPEIMEVFEFDPVKVHFTSQDATRMTADAEYFLSMGNVRQAGQLLEQSLRLDPQSSRTHCLIGNAYLAIGNLDKAEGEFRTTLQLNPDYWDAQLSLAELAIKRNQAKEAVAQLESIVKKNPFYIKGFRTLAQVYQTFGLDSVKSSYYLRRYNELSQAVAP